MDPVLGSVVGSAIAGVTGIAIAVIAGRHSADRLRLEDLVRRLKRYIVDTYKENPDDVDKI